MLSKKEIKRVRKGADLLAKSSEEGFSRPLYACEAVEFGELAKKFRDFYNPSIVNGHLDWWDGLPYDYTELTFESQLQRQLMLELFAHLKGEL